MRILGRELRFGDPGTADIVIFDECNQEMVRKALDERYSVAVFKVRPEEIWISIRVLLNLLRSLHQVDLLQAAGRQRGLLRELLRQVRYIYFKSCLLLMKPKAVVTFIDNSASFHWLSKKCKLFPFVAIQNGSRLRYASRDTPDYYLQHLFCWGEHEVKLFPEIGFKVENFYPTGSLTASLHSNQDASAPSDAYEILVVSSWRGNIVWSEDVVDTLRSMEIMDRLMVRYIRSRNLKAAVILRAERNGEHWNVPGLGAEDDYYRNIYGDSVDIIDTDFRTRNIFALMKRCHIIISCLSSALVEAFGFGKKVLYCNFTGTDRYHSDFLENIVTTDSSWKSFSARLDDLRAMGLPEYRRLNSGYAAYLMKFPGDCSTQEAIRRGIHELIVARTEQYDKA